MANLLSENNLSDVENASTSRNNLDVYSKDEVKGLFSSSDDGKGDALIGVKSVLPNSASRTQHDKNSDIVSLLDFTGAWDGIVDDTENFKNAINTLSSDPTKNSRCLYVPDTVKILLTSDVTLPMDIRITGSITPGYAHNGVAGNLTQKGCSILLKDGASIIMQGNCTIDRMHIVRAGMTGTESDADDYSGTAIKMTKDNHSNMRILNSYVIGFNQGVYAVASILGKIIIDNTGFDCINGVEIGPTGDAPEIRYCMFWPFGTIGGTNPDSYRNGSAMYFHDCSWPSVERTGVYGYENGIRGDVLTNFNATEFSYECVGSGTNKGGGFCAVYLTGNCITPRISNSTMKHTEGYHIRANMTDGSCLTVDNCQFTDYDKSAIFIEAGSAIINNISTIGNSSEGIIVSSGVRTCLINNFYSSGDDQSVQVNNDNTVIHNLYKQESSGSNVYVSSTVQNPKTATTGASLDVRTHLNFYTVSGTATIKNIRPTYPGHVITLMCTDTVTFNTGTTGDGQVRCYSGSQVVTGNQIIQFVCVGITSSFTWRQISSVLTY